MDEEINKRKLSSRKFIVWVTWLVLVLFYTTIFSVYIFKTKTIPDSLISFFTLLLKYFFGVSLLYLGVNLVGKGLNTAKDILGSAADEVTE